MGQLKAFDPVLDDWVVIPTSGYVGPQGEIGPAGPVGPPGGGVNVVGYDHGGTQVSTGAVNVLTVLAEVTVHIKPDSWYEIGMGWRCIQDLGAAGLAQIECGINNVKLPTHTVISAGADDGLWGGLSRTWVRMGSAFASVEGDYQFVLRAMCSVANKIFYDPEIHLLELSDPNAPTGGGTVDLPAIVAGLGLSGGGDLDLGDATVAVDRAQTDTWYADAAHTHPPGGLDDLDDVDLSTAIPTEGQVLSYDSTALQWVPGDVAGGSTLPDGEPGQVLALDATDQPTWVDHVVISATEPVAPRPGQMWVVV